MIALYLVLGGTLLLALAVIVSYNRFIRQRNLIQESWRQIDVELTRRHELIPNLVETVKGYAAHERTALATVVEARNAAVAASGSVTKQAAAESTLSGSLRGLFALAEAYPDLKAAGPFQELQGQLEETENRIAAGRRFYNGNVRAMNTRVEAFPSSIVASFFSFKRADYFETDDPAVRAPVVVSFDAPAPPAQPGPPATPAPTAPTP